MSLYIAAWRNLATVNGSTAPVPHGPPAFEGVVAVGGASLQSALLTVLPDSPGGFVVRLTADEPCHVAIGLNPTAATTGGFKLGSPGAAEWVGFSSGHRIAVIGV